MDLFVNYKICVVVFCGIVPRPIEECTGECIEFMDLGEDMSSHAIQGTTVWIDGTFLGFIIGGPSYPGIACTDHRFTLPPTGPTFEVTVVDNGIGCGGDVQIASVCVTGKDGTHLDHCGGDEVGTCKIYHSPPGCDQCLSGSFKKSYYHPCVDCQEIFGNVCPGCNDYSGCCSCSPINDFTLTKDVKSGLWYCKPSPCLNPENNCQVCNNGLCSQCVYPYTLDADGKSCS